MAAIKNAHIFSVGTWNKTIVTAKTLDGIVTAFNSLAQAGRVPLKFGHNDDQPLTDGQPALGWVSKVWHDGKRLFADFADVPGEVFKAIQNKLYKFVSVELLQNAERDGKKYPYVLDAVALLGADPPAVTNLSELEALATMTRIAYTAPGERANFRQEIKITGGDDSMDPKELQEAIARALATQLAPMNEKIGALETTNVDLKKKFDASESERVKLQKQVDDAKAAEKTGKVKMARETATTLLEGAVRAKKITPAQRDSYKKLFKLDDDDAVLALEVKQIEDLVSINVKEALEVINGKQAFSRDPQQRQDVDGASDPNDELSSAVLKYAREHHVDAFAALAEVVKDPRLGRAFIQTNFEPWEARH